MTLPTELLWDPLPDPLPRLGRPPSRWRQRFLDQMAAAGSPKSDQEILERRVRRDNVRAIVREAFQATVAEQDYEHRGPSAFVQAWQLHLAGLLEQITVEVPGWSAITVTNQDVDLAWSIFELGCHYRQKAIQEATISPIIRVDRGVSVPTFKFSVMGEDHSLGDVIYGTCQRCRIGLLFKISFNSEWHCCGFGRRALSHLEAIHPDSVWYTTGQSQYARCFYDRFRQGSNSPWEPNQHPCPHFK